ncbi:hypothetical protein ACJJTC_002087 [Scirpophaga incertulas]
MDSSVAGSSGIKKMSRKQLFDIMQQRNGENMQKKIDHLEDYLLSRSSYSEDQIKDIKQKLSVFKHEFKQKWSAASRKLDLFTKKNKNWLLGCLELPVGAIKPGRPTKSFEESSERSKRRKTQNIRESTDIEELTYAAQMKLRSSGKVDASKVLQEITQSPTRAKKYRTVYSKIVKDKSEPISTFKALCMFVEADLSRRQYEIIAATGKKIFPCYSLLQKAKKYCYPPAESFRVTATCAEVSLQQLLDHTAARLLLYLKEVVETLSQTDRSSLELISKWGCDGSQQTKYKQKFENSADSDANIFQSSFVPLRLVSGADKRTIIWQNPTPSSPRYCRPIRIRFIKESTDIIKEEIAYIKSQIALLIQTKIENSTQVKHTLLFTMVDGKVCNAATNVISTMKCYICGATSKDFNNLSKEKAVDSNALQFGLSILHARIRLFETLLHLSYKMDVKKPTKQTRTFEPDTIKMLIPESVDTDENVLQSVEPEDASDEEPWTGS